MNRPTPIMPIPEDYTDRGAVYYREDADAYMDHLEAENKQLRDAWQSLAVGAYAVAIAENRRLRKSRDQLRTERDRLREGHRLIDGFAQSILEEPNNPNHVRMRAGNIRSWILINAALTQREPRGQQIYPPVVDSANDSREGGEDADR